MKNEILTPELIAQRGQEILDALEDFSQQDLEYQEVVRAIKVYCSKYDVPLDVFLKELLDVSC